MKLWNICKAAALAAILAFAALGAPSAAIAGNVGYFNNCPEYSGDMTGVVTTAGHTKVDIATLDAGSLSGLSALVITTCNRPSPSNAAVATAVSNGMGLVFERLLDTGPIDTTTLPGGNGFGSGYSLARNVASDNVDIAAGAPIATGPGGTLTNTSLDYLSGPTYYNMVFFYPAASLPAGAIPFLTTPDPAQVGSFGYSYGSGRVVYTDSQYSLGLPGGPGFGTVNWSSAGATFLTNALAWAAGSVTTCASEGYTGTKLLWCQKICESDLEGAALDSWIHRWINRYRDLPACAAEEEPVEEEEQQPA